MVQIGLRVPESMANRIRQQAEAEGRSAAGLTYELVQAALARAERADIITLSARIDYHDKLINALLAHCFPNVIQAATEHADATRERNRDTELIDGLVEAMPAVGKA